MENARLRVLLVDDDPDIRVIARMALERLAGWEVWDAELPEAALALAEQINPHVILLDMMMPDMDGFEVLARLRNNKATKHVPIIFMTARALDTQILQNVEQRIAGMITKPFDAMTLAGRIRELLAGLPNS